MHHTLTSILVALPLTFALSAQEDAAEAMSNPKTAHHERLATLAGTWKAASKMAAMPGVPGMEKATESVGTERAELICNGLWLKVSGDGEMGGQACSGIWLLGYDPIAERYQCLCASSTEESTFTMEADYDAESKTWRFEGDTPMGRMRSEFTVENADRTVEVCYATGEDGKETEFMRIVRTRVKDGTAVEASAPHADGEEVEAAEGDEAQVAPARRAMLAEVGNWDAAFKMEMPGAPAMTSKCREVVMPICDGMFTWSDFTGEVMGMPFEGHALVGHDSTANKVTCFWIDSMTGAFMRTDGTYDAKSKTFTMSGTSYDEQGEEAPVNSTTTQTSEGARRMRMVFGEGDESSVMTIDYARAK